MSDGIKQNIDKLLSAEMDRASFLKYCGLAVLATIGITGLMRALSGVHPEMQGKQSSGYGGSRYGD